MILYHATADDLAAALATVNDTYAGNVEFKTGPTPVGRRFRFTLRVGRSDGPGHRVTHMRRLDGGRRRNCAACWHVHRDFLAALFDHVPGARVVTMLADYAGVDGFARDFPETAYHNAGSRCDPLEMGVACECAEGVTS